MLLSVRRIGIQMLDENTIIKKHNIILLSRSKYE